MKHEDHAIRPRMGLLNLDEGDKRYCLTRYAPSEALSSLVKHFWIVSWDLTGHDPYPQHVVPNPCVNLVVERGNTFFFGPSGQKFSYLVREKGCVFGVKFKPGGFYPFIRTPVSTLYGNPLGVSGVLDVDAPMLEERLLGNGNDADKVSYMDQLLCKHLPPPDDQAILVSQIVLQIEQQRDMLRVDDLSASWNMHTRKLQRCSISMWASAPKW